MGDRLSTGVDALDRRLSGGLAPGDLVAIVTSPATQSQALITELMRRRPTLYISTLLSETAVRSGLTEFDGADSPVVVQRVGGERSMDNAFLHELTGSRTYSVASTTEDTILDDVYEALQQVDGQCNVVVDPTNPLERTGDREAYREVLDTLKTTMLRTESVGILHCITLEEAPAFRETTLMVADVVWELNVRSVANDDVEFQLRIPKNRSGNAVLEEITLLVDNGRVYVDDSRNI